MKKKESKLKGTIVRESVMKNKNSNEKKESKLKDNKGIKLERFSEKNPEHAQT